MYRNIVFFLLLSIFSSCGKLEIAPNSNVNIDILADSITFAMIGDYGKAGTPTQAVSRLVKSWSPDFIVTLGDNNYDKGTLATIKDNITQYYADYIYNPDAPAEYRCTGLAAIEKQNRFFPTLGNHDQNNIDRSIPYLSYFTLPVKETYYDFKWGPVHFFTINSGSHGEAICCDSEQAVWLQNELSKSNAPFKVVYFHHSPFSSGHHGNHPNMQWPFEAWGASTVITGHNHIYQRVYKTSRPDFPYIINGLGGKSIHSCDTHPLDENGFEQFCYNANYGAIKAKATRDQLVFQFFSLDDEDTPIDVIRIER